VPDNTFEKCSEGVLEALVAGVSVADTARQHGIASRTIDRWLARGRRDPESKYGPFAEAVDRARADRELPPPGERPADPAELRLLISKAARKGNVQAMRLLWEVLGSEDGQDHARGDILDELGGGSARRATPLRPPRVR
jgi:transposase-like protein